MNPVPSAFEIERLRKALRDEARVLVGVGLFALFAGALLARFAVHDAATARVAVRIPASLAPAPVLDDDVLARAQRQSPELTSLALLRERVHVARLGGERWELSVRAVDAPSARALATTLAAGWVALVNGRAERQAALRIAQAREEQARLNEALAAALRQRGVEDANLGEALARARTALAALPESATEAGAAGPPVTQIRAELLEAQRSLSRLLTVQDERAPEARAQKARIGQLRTQLRQRARVRAASAEREPALATRRAALSAEVERLEALSSELTPAMLDAARAAVRVNDLQAASASAASRASVVSEVRAERADRRLPRLGAALLSPLVALSALAAFYAAKRLHGLRVCASTEVAYWLGVPVLGGSEWPGREQALEPLAEELGEASLAAKGLTLVLPLTELERPLAATVAARLNARAQRKRRSPTGSRVTLAQAWQGDLDGARIKRAVVAADRVLWVVAADAHRGRELARRRKLIERTQGVAALLLDAEAHHGAAVGDVRAFWATPSAGAEREASPDATSGATSSAESVEETRPQTEKDFSKDLS